MLVLSPSFREPKIVLQFAGFREISCDLGASKILEGISSHVDSRFAAEFSTLPQSAVAPAPGRHLDQDISRFKGARCASLVADFTKQRQSFFIFLRVGHRLGLENVCHVSKCSCHSAFDHLAIDIQRLLVIVHGL
jgi:hypothetical protein